MNSLTVASDLLPATAPEALPKIAAVEAKMRRMPQITPRMEHLLHAGMYARTCRVNAGDAFVSVMIKVPTVLIVNGWARVFAGDCWYEVQGYRVIPASAMRKMIYVVEEPTEITMIFPTEAATVEEAEAEFTDEAASLLSREQGNDLVTITGVKR